MHFEVSFVFLSDFLTGRFVGNLSQIETLVLNVSGRILMVNKENNGNATENLVSCITFICFSASHGRYI